MAKNPMQDIVPKGGKSIRNIPLPESRVKAALPRVEPRRKKPVDDIERIPKTERMETPVRIEKKPAEYEPLSSVKEDKESAEEIDRKRAIQSARRQFEASAFEDYPVKTAGKKWRKLGIVGAVVLVLALAVLVSSFFAGAAVTLTPRRFEASIKSDYTAKKSEAVSSLAYQVITIKESGSEAVKAQGEKQVDKRATGTIVIYNNYSSSPQRLIKNTRFMTPEGLVYRISESVNVPGKTGTAPGSVEAVVTADEPGEKYNAGLKDFTIPGFKGDPRYTAFYARSKTALSGGFSGIQKVVEEADRAKAKQNIEAKVTQKLKEQIALQVPSDKVTFENAYKIEFADLPEASSPTDVTIREEGTLSLVVFDRGEISKAVAKNHVPGYKDDPIAITNISEVSFVPKEPFRPASSDSIAFGLNGNAKFEWVYDEKALKEDLAGQPRSEVSAVLQKYPMIEKADISLRPLWARKFPESVEKIELNKVE